MVKMTENPNAVGFGISAIVDTRHRGGWTAYQYASSYDKHEVIRRIEHLTALSHGVSALCGWHHDPVTGEPIERNVGEMIALMHSELSEAMEADRKGLMDDKLPHRLGIEVELADLLHRVFDFAGKHHLDLGGAYYEKAMYNSTRQDHKPENRIKEGGKAY